jgi:hypothetical protein
MIFAEFSVISARRADIGGRKFARLQLAFNENSAIACLCCFSATATPLRIRECSSPASPAA